MKRSERLELVLSFVEKGEAAADVGTDHGHVPIELIARGITARAYAMDVRPGPLSRAKENIKAWGLEEKIETRLSDGLERLKPGEADSVIIAGMGGELIIHILTAGSHMWDSVRQWVLSPHSEVFKVRKWLWEHGFVIVKEAMVLEEGKYYTVLDVRPVSPGTALVKEKTEKEWHYGEILARAGGPVFAGFLEDEEKKLSALLESLSALSGQSERIRERIEETKKHLEWNWEVRHEMQRGR